MTKKLSPELKEYRKLLRTKTEGKGLSEINWLRECIKNAERKLSFADQKREAEETL